jgi:hypothetical protein
VFGAPLGIILSELRTTGRTLKPALVFDIIRRATEGLAYIQDTLGEAHAGLDPHEVLIGYHGEVKIGDQRLHALDRLVLEAHRSDSIYLSPQVRAGVRQADLAGDVYSMALIMLEMLIGQPVWSADSMSVEAFILALRDFAHTGSAYPDLTEDVVDLLGSCVASESEARIESAEALKDALAVVASKNDMAPDPEALGAFVRTLIPRQRADEAPTMLVSTHTEGRVSRFDAPEFTAASVQVDPKVVDKARVRELQISASGAGPVGRPALDASRGANPMRRSRKTGNPARGAEFPMVAPRRHPNGDGPAPRDPLDALPGGKRTAWILFGVGMLAILVLLLMVIRGV